MYVERFLDQTLGMIEAGEVEGALPLLAGNLFASTSDSLTWPDLRSTFRQHPIYKVLQEDPFAAHSTTRPRGYQGDAGLIDMIYDMQPPPNVSPVGRRLFDVTIRFQAPEAVRQRRIYAEKIVAEAWQAGKRVLVLACGHFREADDLAGSDLAEFTLVDQDPVSLERVRTMHGYRINLYEANVFRYLRQAATQGEKFDLIYTLGLTDYLDTKAMELLCRFGRKCLARGGHFVLANFLPGHLGTGWMDAVMDWHLVYRNEQEFERYAADVGLAARTWRDATDSIIWCEMSDAGSEIP